MNFLSFVISLALLCSCQTFGKRISKRNMSLRDETRMSEREAMDRDEDLDPEGFKKERGVRGQCFYTYLELDSTSVKKAVALVHGLEGWEPLAQADARYSALDDEYNKLMERAKANVDPLEESEELKRLEPITNIVNNIKEYQRDMTKTLLELVKLAIKNEFVTYFYQLDTVGKIELPCVKAIQENYASKYPELLAELTSEVRTETRAKMDDSKRVLEQMIRKYLGFVDNLEAEATKLPEIKAELITDGWKFPDETMEMD